MKAEAQTVRGESTVVGSTVETPRPAPVKGLSRLTTYIRGKEILILGPGNAGKTKFAQYLQRAALDPEGKREMTYAVTRSPSFVVDFGQKDGPVLRVRRAVDTPGQVGPLQHALLVARRRPHAVIVMLDCSSDPLATLRWFCLFCNALDSVLRKVAPVARRLQEMVVLLNKRDKIEDKEFAKLHQAARKVLERFLTVAWGEERVQSIPIQECILARTRRGTALIDGVIAGLTERLLKRPDAPAPLIGPRPFVPSPADPLPGPSDPLFEPAPALSSEPPQPAAAVGPGPAIVLPAGPSPDPSDPSSEPAPAPSSGPQSPIAAVSPGPVAVPPANSPPGPPHPSSEPAPTPSSGPPHPAVAAGPKPPIVPLVGSPPGPPHPSSEPVPTAPVGPPHPAIAAGPRPPIVPLAGTRPYSSRPPYEPVRTPSSGPAGQEDQQTAEVGSKSAIMPPPGLRPYSPRPPYKPAPIPPAGLSSPAAATPAAPGVRADASGPKEKSKASGTSSGAAREAKAGSSDKQDATSDKSQTPNDKGQPPNRSTFRSRWPVDQ
jgi:hypothetical protein